MRAGELVAAVDKEPPVGHVQSVGLERPLLAKSLARRQVERSVGGEMCRPVTVQKSRTIRDIGCGPASPGEIDVEAGAERVSLVEVQEVITAGLRGLKIGQAARDASLSFDVLVRIGEMHSRPAQEPRRPHTCFPAANACPLQGDGEEDAGVSQDVVVEVIAGTRPEVVDLDRPGSNGDGEPELVLFVAFSSQGQEVEPLRQREFEQRPAERLNSAMETGKTSLSAWREFERLRMAAKRHGRNRRKAGF